MLDSGQSEVFVSNVSGHSQPPSWPPILSEPWPFLIEGILRPRREQVSMPGVTFQGAGPSSRPEDCPRAQQELLTCYWFP